MSRSQIACAIDASTTTIVRVKSTGAASFCMTMCRTLNTGLEAMSGPKGKKAAMKLCSMLREWKDEPVAVSYSPAEILTLPAWFPASATRDSRDRLCRIEAGYFLKNIEQWSWHVMSMTKTPDHPVGLERQMLMFYPAEPSRSLEKELKQGHTVGMSGLHIEPVASLSAGTTEPFSVLELEERYAAYYVSVNGIIGYFRYWPVKNGHERDYFAISELTSSPGNGAPVWITGTAADAPSLQRIRRETARTVEPLGMPPRVTSTKDAGTGKSMTSMVRAVSTALMALS
ncbi:MAG: hypothetical protein HGB00_00335 [Chlorobiaceae bacterium]|nr:hypothetical protein [Chlorobiaceae bacterium]